MGNIICTMTEVDSLVALMKVQSSSWIFAEVDGGTSVIR